VCSGCSGDYAGDFEDSGDLTRGSGCDHAAWGDVGPEEGCNSHVMHGFEAQEHSTWNSGNSPVAADEVSGGTWEIMVSATRIVEIRVVRANPEEIYEFSEAEAARKPATNKHPQPASAKYYQTKARLAEIAGNGLPMPIFRGFAACAMAEIEKWSRRMRNALWKECLNEFPRV